MSGRSQLANLKSWRTSLTVRVLSGGSLGFVFKITGMLLQFAGTIALTRALGVDDYSVYAFVLVAVQLVTVPVANGCRRVLVRLVAETMALAHWAELKGLWLPAQGGLVVFMTLVGLLSLGILYLAEPVILSGSRFVLAWALLIPVLMTTLRYHEGMLRGLGHVGLAQFPVMVLRPLIFVILVAVALFQLGPAGLVAESAFSFLALSFALSLAVAMGWLTIKIPADARAAKLAWHPGRWSRAALPFVLVSGGQQVQTSAGVLVLGALGGTTDVAYFHVANRLSEIMDLGYLAAAIAIEPVVTRLYSHNEMKRLGRVMTRIIRIVAVVTLVIAIIAIWFGDSLLMLFGRDYHAARPIFTILVVYSLFAVFVGMGDLVLSMTAHAGLVARVAVFSAVLTLALCVSLIPFLGATGAALAFAVGLLPGKLYMWWRARRLFGIDTSVFGFHRAERDMKKPRGLGFKQV